MSGGDLPPVLFDLDGTLIATRHLYLEAFADALEAALDRRPTHDEMMALRPRAEVRFLLDVAGPDAHADVMSRFWTAYETRHTEDFEGIYPGVPELLANLRDQGVPLGLVTGKSRRTWEITRTHLEGALGPFDAWVFDDDVPASKPDPAGILLALEALGALDPRSEKEGCVYVGDTSSDLEAARRAGIVPVGVLWSKRPSEREAFAARARSLGGFVVESPDELLDALASARASAGQGLDSPPFEARRAVQRPE